MPAWKPRSFRKAPFIAASMAATLAWGTPSQARVTAMVTDSRAPVFDGVPIGSAGPYETLHGRVFGELDPGDPHNTIIQDTQFAPRDAHGKVPAAFVESAVNEIIAKRMNKKQQMRWNRTTVQSFLDVRYRRAERQARGRLPPSRSGLPAHQR